MTDNIADLLITRRDFVKVVGAGAASLLIPGCEGKPEQAKTSKRKYPIEIKPGLEKIADMDHERYNCSVLSHKNLIHVIGGSSDWRWTWPTAKYSTFDPENLICTPRKEMDEALARMASFVFEEDIMTVGGKMSDKGELGSGPIVDYVFRHDVCNNEWHTLRPFKFPISSAQAVVPDGTPCILGGYIKNGEINLDILVYDKSKDNWDVKTRIPKPVDKITAAAKDGKIYVFGSRYDWQGKEMVMLQIYNFRKDKWEDEKEIPWKFKFMHAFIHDNDPCLWVCNEGFNGGRLIYDSADVQDHAMFSSRR